MIWHRGLWLIVYFALLPETEAFAQTSLALHSATATPGSSVAVDLALSAVPGNEPAALQWSVSYPASSVLSVNASAGPAALASGKPLSCVARSGGFTCVLAGINPNTVSSGVVATVTLGLSPQISGDTQINVTGAVAATFDGSDLPLTSSSGVIHISGPASLSALTCNPSSLLTPGSTNCTVSLSAAAPAGGLAVALSSGSPALTVPATVTVPAGSSSATFAAAASSVASNTSAVITASLNGSSAQATLSLLAPLPALSGLNCSLSTLTSGTSTTCAVTLTQAAPASGATVALSSNSSSLTVPASVLVPAGSTAASFTATAGTIPSSGTANLTASLNGTSKTASVSLTAPPPGPVISTVTCSPTTVQTPGSTSCTVALSAAAPASGVQVLLSSGSLALTVPASVTVPGGATSTSFNASASAVPSNTSAVITATLNGGSAQTTVLLLASSPPTTVSGLSCTPWSVGPGGATSCAVTLSKAAPAGGASVAISSSSLLLTVSATVSVAAGATSASFTAIAGTITINGIATITASLNGSSAGAEISLNGDTLRR